MKEVKSAAKYELNEEQIGKWLELMKKISMGKRSMKVSGAFAQLSEHLFCCPLSSIVDDDAILARNKINKIINCSSASVPIKGMQIVTIPEVNAVPFISANFNFIQDQLEEVRLSKMRAVVTCASGVNRAGVLCAAYLIWWRKATLVSTLQTMADRLGPFFGIESYQKDLLHFANELGRLDHPTTWPTFDDELTVRERLASGWEKPSGELFNDDADYDNRSAEDIDIRSPQELAELRYRQAANRHQQLEKMQGKTTASDCASDGGTDLL
eukprot:Gregarina_sp_Poly_1__2137@NODE_1567_length_3829_cov_208_686603_g1034_i0_p2_GENE_NODE_1567_length_3829_cov_208_686603_g1034_i0NODE_1567_length_3829_cov_208_686603_g1034_i0_p2_ORF_typecomplete_len269_score43_47DSPc/PF00782_20/9_6e10CDKN3/PF05706_12/0_0069CDKN3/PF05706_12/9e03Y_phosphatase/PF00102_27/0_043Y_phosphatase3/PF13350_6/0_17Y_phosphatase3/PF13350_6/1_7e03_NODE_1567_length_3829_cov_208_686603_g1034_i06061412